MRRQFALVSTLLLAGCLADEPTRPPTLSAGASPTASLADAEPTGSHVVLFSAQGAIPAGFQAAVSALGAAVTHEMEEIGVALVSGLSPEAAAAVEALDGVEAVAADLRTNFLKGVVYGDTVGPAQTSASPSLPTRWNQQWGLHRIQANQAWEVAGRGSPAVKVAILDTGIDYGHQEMAGKVDLALSRSFIPDDPVGDDHPVMDLHLHGTHVAGIVAAKGVEMAGVAPMVTLVGVKVLSMSGSGTFGGVTSGIHYAGKIGVDVINMSLGADVPREDREVQKLTRAIERAIRYAEAKGAIVISAAGNSERNLNDPAVMSTPCEQSTLCVTATGPIDQQDFDQPAFYTSYGAAVIDVAAPGGNCRLVADFTCMPYADQRDVIRNPDLVVSACSRRATTAAVGTTRRCQLPRTDGSHWYVGAGGTSMASPHVAGIAALVDSRYGGALRARELRDRILAGADDLGTPGKDDWYGHGRVNAYGSVR